MARWTVPRCFEGRTVVVMASGHGMTAEVAAAVHASGCPAIVTNSTFRLTPWAWMLYGADPEWWNHPANRDARDFAGFKVTCQPGAGVLQLRSTGIDGFDPATDAVRTGGNSAYQALHVAVHTGAARVILCGVNVSGAHWHDKHPPGLRETTDETYATWCRRFADVAPVLSKLGVDVVNCTPNSALTCFRRATLGQELAYASRAELTAS